MLNKLNQRGDTIVEILIAITIISFMLASGFVLSNQSLIEERQSEERAESLQIVQSQLEALRAGVTSKAFTLSAQTPPFCMVGLVPTASTQAACTVDSSGNPTTGDPAYHIATTYTALSPGYNVSIQSTWNQVGGGTENVTLVYRLYGN